MCRNWNSQLWLIGILNEATVLENNLAVTEILKIELLYDWAVLLTDIFLGEIKLCEIYHTILYNKIYNTITHT